MNDSSSLPRIHLTTLLGLFYIFTFWKSKPRHSSQLLFFCCLKKSKHPDSCKRKQTDKEVEQPGKLTDTHHCTGDVFCYNSTGEFSGFSNIGVKRNCELPPVPIAGRTSQVLDGERGGAHKPKSPMPQSPSILPPLRTSTENNWFDPHRACDDEGLPYSFCRPPASELDPLYASVGGGGIRNPDCSPTAPSYCEANVGLSHRILRQRVNSEPQAGNLPNSVKIMDEANHRYHHHHQEGSSGWARVYAAPGSKCDSETGEDFYSGSVVPYYSSIVNDGALTTVEDRSRSPFYQDEPALPTSHQADVYAQVQLNRPKPGRTNHIYSSPIGQNRPNRKSDPMCPGPLVAGPPVPTRSYNSFEVEYLLNQRRINSIGDSSNDNDGPPVSGTSSPGTSAFDDAKGVAMVDRRRRRLSDRFQAGFRHRSLGFRISQVSKSSASNQASGDVGRDVNHETRRQQNSILNQASEDQEQNLSTSDDKYRNITVRESIASLRARNALPAFLTDPKFRSSVPTSYDAEYEGVYWYSDDRPDSGNPYESASHLAASHNRDQVDSSSGGAGGGPQDTTSDPYTEIPGSS